MGSMLERIDAAIRAATDAESRAEWLARKGCYWARVGDSATAAKIVAELRESGVFTEYPRVAIRGMLVEGLSTFFGVLDPVGRDRVLRAQALALAGPFPDLVDLTTAWLAHFDFNANDFGSCSRRLQLALGREGPLDEEAALRATLVFADLCMYAGRPLRAREAYESARRASVEQGDQASMAAMFYNKAALSLSWVRTSSAAGIGPGPVEAFQFLQDEIRSATAYHVGAGQASLTQLLMWMRARAKLQARDFGEAATLYREVLENGLAQNLAHDDAAVKAEYAECLLELGSVDGALAVLEPVIGTGLSRMAADDALLLADFVDRFRARISDSEVLRRLDVAAYRQAYLDELSFVQNCADAVDRVVEAKGLLKLQPTRSRKT